MHSLSLHLLSSVLFITGAFTGMAQEKAVKVTTGEGISQAELVPEGDGFRFTGRLDYFELSRPDGAQHPDGTLHLDIGGYFPTGEEGSPELPAGSHLFESGPGARVVIHRLDSMVVDLEKCGFSGKLAPVPPARRKDRELLPAQADSLSYLRDEWLGGPVLSVSYEGILRGVPLSTLQFRPFRYNPARNRLVFYHHVQCTIEPVPGDAPSGPGDAHIGPGYTPSGPGNPFGRLFDRVALCRRETDKKAVLSDRPLSMVILSDTAFRERLRPLADWKRKKGFHVIEAYTQDPAVGSTRESIKAYLGSLYTAPPSGTSPPAYLLIVGDVRHIPLSQSTGQVTDLYYATYDGEGDYLPDVFYGRISVDNGEQLQAVIDKILEYEQFLFDDPSFLGEAVLIAGVDGAFAARHGNGQINYAGKYYFNPSRGIHAHNFLYPDSDTGGPAIIDLVSRGVGFVNYTGHGLYDGWIDPPFRQDDIPKLENRGKYPLIVGNGCGTNLFSLEECFAESLLRAPGRGALAYIGCTNDSYWDEDFYWSVGVGPIVADPVYGESTPGYYDRIFHLNGEDFGIWAPSLGEMIFGGNLSVQQSTSPRKKFYWEIYQLAGDPSIVPWFGIPASREVLFPGVIPAGTARLDVKTAPYDYAALSAEGVLLDAGHAGPEGLVTLQLPDTTGPCTLDLVVTGQGFTPFTGTIVLGSTDAAHLELGRHFLSDESEADDGVISSGESVSFDLELINRGGAVLPADTLQICSPSAEITILDGVFPLDEIPPGDTLTVGPAFRVEASGSAGDGTTVIFELRRKGAPGAGSNYIREQLAAPLLRSHGICWDDRPWGNGNGIAEPSEWLKCTWTLENSGHFRSGPIRGGSPGSPLFDSLRFGPGFILEKGEQRELVFRARVGAVTEGAVSWGVFTAGDRYRLAADSFPVVPGRHFEDFGQGDPGRYPFGNDTVFPWTLDGTSFHSAPFSLRSGKVGAEETSRLSMDILMDTSGTFSFAWRVSSEAGYDFLRFYVDSVLMGSWSGERPWSRFTCPLEPGSHRVTWLYRKDHSVSHGEDAAWIDDVVFPAGAFRRKDLSLLDITSPRPGPWLSDREEVRLLVANTGTDTLHGFTADIGVEGSTVEGSADDVSILKGSPGDGSIHEVSTAAGSQPAGDSFLLSLAPGERREIHTGIHLDLSAIGDYRLMAEVTTTGEAAGKTGSGSTAESFTGNNRLEKVISHYPYPDIALELERIEEAPGARADALVQVRNTGNLPIDSLYYQVRLDSLVRSGGSRFIGLEPGEEELLVFCLADSTDETLASGFYDYTICSLVPDSVPGNDRIAGVLYWQASGTSEASSFPDLLVYPNPAGTGFHILFSAPAAAPVHLELLDTTGRVCGRYLIPDGSGRLYVPVNVPPGTYLLTIPGTGTAIPVVVTN